MNVSHPVGGKITEATSQIIPSEGVSIFAALKDAELSGFQEVIVHPDNTATVVWFKEASDGRS